MVFIACLIFLVLHTTLIYCTFTILSSTIDPRSYPECFRHKSKSTDVIATSPAMCLCRCRSIHHNIVSSRCLDRNIVNSSSVNGASRALPRLPHTASIFRYAPVGFLKRYNSAKNWRRDMRQKSIFSVFYAADAYAHCTSSYHDTQFYMFKLFKQKEIKI